MVSLSVYEGVESVECGPVRPLAAVLVEPLIRGKVKDDDAWSKHSRVVCCWLHRSVVFDIPLFTE